MIVDATTMSGAVYRIDREEGFWMKWSRQNDTDLNKVFVCAIPTEKIWSLKVGDHLAQSPWERPDLWVDSDLPVFDKHLFISAKNYWVLSTPIVNVSEVKSWDSPITHYTEGVK